ncbi:MAG: glycosyltransferase family 4 protein [Paramuribaculum sp.]|nr:glycosyltransferase family 4 protein [Paramuribaculum sp.]MDE6303914.1 glycosyltransferase family 4 protein [Paramuribaculum sp.]
MKIALVNYRYFISGGPERYYFNIKEILERNGHTVIPFSIKSPKNFKSEFDDYFMESVDDEEYFVNTRKTPATVLKSFSRMFYSREAYRKFSRLLKDTKPDVVYIMQYHNKISPSIIYAAKKAGVRVVHRISDFQYLCPNALFYNDTTGVCEDCLNGKLISCVKNKCVHGSALLSAIKVSAKAFHDMLGIAHKIDDFVVPSKFTLGKLAQFGIDQARLHHIPTFFNGNVDQTSLSYEPFFLYIGRVEKEKGIKTLIDAFTGTSHKLIVIGFSNNGYDEELKKSLEGKEHNIEFTGRMDFAGISGYLSRCLCTLVPSESYDNMPNTILEAFAYSKAVIATDFGSLPELVIDKVTGLTFPYGDVEALRQRIDYMSANPAEAMRMGKEARKMLDEKFTPEVHYRSLIEILKNPTSA